MNRALEILNERGFLKQCTNLSALSDRMDKGQISFYVGIDPTGRSLHIGHMLPIFALKHLTDAGHRGCVLIGGGTARIGDPSGKTEMRKMLSYQELDANSQAIIQQLDPFLHFDGKNIFSENNKTWLADLNYIDFLREIGSHFSVNRMLTFEAYKKRMETGLSFIEFNYQLLQSYDFLMLNRMHGIDLQIGGDDQWGNIVAGSDLIRRLEGKEVFGLTFPLVTRSDGQKMGKSEKGALFLDPELLSPFDFFQYWRNVMDADVRRFLLLFTFLPVARIEELCSGNINEAKEALAYEVTALIHGKVAAQEALQGARAAFSGGMHKDALPTVTLTRPALEEGISITGLFVHAGLCKTTSEARRLIQQGGLSINGTVQTNVTERITPAFLNPDGELILKMGKKKITRVIITDA